MRKKYNILILIFAFFLTFSLSLALFNRKVFAEDSNFLNIETKACLLMDSNSKSIIYSKNENERYQIASMCKIMTLNLIFDEIEKGNLCLNDKIIVSENASNMGGSQVFLEANSEYEISQLVKGIVVASANDACVAMAETICGSEELFVSKMNEKANELGMTNTLFSNCTGLPKPTQYSCAKDVALMFNELLSHKDYFKFSNIWMDKIEHKEGRFTEISNTNKLIRFYDGCDSGKTGYTSEAGHCLSSSAIRNGMRLVSVLICSPNSKTRFKEASELFNYGFANYTNKKVLDKNTPLDIECNVLGGQKNTVSTICEKDLFLFSKKNEQRNVEINFVPLEKIKAPVKKGDILGKLLVFENNKQIDEISVLANEDIEKQTYFNSISNIAKNWEI